jgi:NAD(P)-dependent dehydrogenase (short-subunit alcohol dehydrogenase family)
VDHCGKAAIVTGGGQGIGKAIAWRLLKEGLGVVIAEADAEAGEETEHELKAFGDVRFMHTDVASEEQVKRVLEGTLSHFRRLDLIVNNAGIMIPKPVTDLSLEEWNRVLAVNLTGAFLLAKHGAPFLRENHGAIVNIASTRALMSEEHTEAYSASKGGLTALTHALAVSLGPEIRVHCISPGWIEVGEWKKRSLRQKPELTPEDHGQHPCGRVGRPEDIADLVVYLLSATFMTGENIVVDGGMTRKMFYV